MIESSYQRGSGYLTINVPRTDQGKASFRIIRLWRSFSRMQRNFSLMILLLMFVILCYFSASRMNSQNSANLALVRIRNIRRQGLDQEIDDKNQKNVDFDQIDEVKKKEKGNGLSEEIQNGNIEKPKYPKFKGPQNERQLAVVDAFKFAWKGYKSHAWGHDHLKPVSRSYSEWFGLGLTIVDSLDTMIIMGLDDEFEEARNWVAESLNFDKNTFVSFFEVSIRVLGGLLSAYHLSGDKMFVEKATDIGDRLLSAYSDSSAVPVSDVNLKMRFGKQPPGGGESSLSEVTTVQLEFRDLSRVTGNSTFEKVSFATSQHIHRIGCKQYDGLCGMFIDPETGVFRSVSTITVGARADSYYEYLLKQWLQTGKTIEWLKEDYEQSISAMQKHLVRQSKPSNLSFVGEILPTGAYSPKMDHLVCFLAGALALGKMNGLPEAHLELGEALGQGCQKMYQTATGLWPEIIYFNIEGQGIDITIKEVDAHCLLRPEAIEAWFYLYRATKKKVVSGMGLESFSGINRLRKS